MGTVLLVRHGQASFGTDDYDVLSETGWEQGRRLGTWLAGRGVGPTSLVRGTMRRHRETLEAVAATAGWPLDDVVEDDGWNEFDHLAVIAGFPDLPQDHVDRRAFQRVFEEATARWIAGEGHGDETWTAFVARVRGALERAVASAGPGRTTVVVTSGGAIAVACAALVDPDGDAATAARLWQRFNTVVVNAAVSRVVAGSTGARLLTFNEHPHVDDELRTYR